MKKTKFFKLLGMALVIVMALGLFAGCKDDTEPETDNTTEVSDTEDTADTTEDTPDVEDDETMDEEPEPMNTTPLVVGYNPFSGKFNPFLAETGYDMDVVGMVNVGLLATDRTGGTIYNGIDGEVIPYNGTDYTYTGISDLDVNYDEGVDQTVYTWTLREGVLFSDGEELTADDVIFSYYVLSDPSYDGSSTVYSVPIVGMQDYRTQTSSAVYDKYEALFTDIYAAGMDYAPTDADGWTQEQADALWAIVDGTWKNDVQGIVDYVAMNYSAYFESYIGFTGDEAMAEDGLKVAGGMALWGFGDVDMDTLVLTTAVTGTEFALGEGVYPSIDDYYAETIAAYGDMESYTNAGESAADVSPMDQARDLFIGQEGPKDESMGDDGVPNIAGIQKVDDYTVTVTVDGYDAVAIDRIGITVAPLHYYGDEAMFDYDSNMFGFPYGDISSVQAVTSEPMGAGPYTFVKYENKIVYFEANENYWRGEPITTYVQFKEGTDADKISGVATGTIDVTDPSFGNDAVDEIKSHNSNGEVVGDVITTNTVDNLGYGYIGISAITVNVNGEPESEASKNLRQGLATLLSAYRELSIDSYYGERASIINYPISNTSWAAPQKSDEGYEVAFSTDVDGNAIYTSDMSGEDKHAAALEAAIGYFVAAGYTYDGSQFTAAPAGAKLEYEIIVPADGAGDHPSFMIATMFKEALESVGFSIILNDPADSNVLWDKLDAETQEIWCAAWGATRDPDMYQIYHSDNSTGSNHYHIGDADLDELILEARTSDDQTFRKATYKACLDIIIDWAVEVPIYQRQNCIIFSTERVNLDTVTPDITTFWGWMNDIELLEMN